MIVMKIDNFDGHKCPFCSSENLTYQPYDFDYDLVTEDVSCDDCGAHWNNNYKLKFLCADHIVKGD